MIHFLKRLFKEIIGRGCWFGNVKLKLSELSPDQHSKFVRFVVRDGHWNRNEARACKLYGVIIDEDYSHDRYITSLCMHGD